MLIELHKNITAYPVGNMAMMMYMQVCIHCLFCRAKIESFSTWQNFICPNYFSKRGKIPVLGYCSYGIFRLILSRFFIGYWILKRGWISILAPLFFLEGRLTPDHTPHPKSYASPQIIRLTPTLSWGEGVSKFRFHIVKAQ